jgi:carnosine N-methyltransferase
LERLGYKQKLADVDDAILANAEFLNQIVANPEIFGHDLSSLKEEDDESLEEELDHPMESHTLTAG